MKEITLSDYFMGRDEEFKSELTPDVSTHASKLLQKVNALLKELEDSGELKSDQDYKITSGWRPTSVNESITNAAKKSLHQTGNAIDILDDKEQTLCNVIKKNYTLLKKYGLWMEDPDHTKGKWTNWCHLDDSTSRSDREIRIFKP